MCDFCGGTGKAYRTSECGARLVAVNCPRCILGVTVRGTHELLRPRPRITVTIGDDEPVHPYVIKSPDGA